MKTKTIYLFDLQGYFAGIRELNERDDMTPITHDWIIPAYSTETPMELDAPDEHHLIRWNGEMWAYVENPSNPVPKESEQPVEDGEKQSFDTKEDYLSARENLPEEQWRAAWQELLDSSQKWVEIKTYKNAGYGKEDETHKLVPTEQDGRTVYIQYELQDDPESKLFTLGFTRQEVIDALNGLEV